MTRAVRIGRIARALTTLEHPIDGADAAGALADVTLLLAVGERNRGDVVEYCPGDSLDSRADLEPRSTSTFRSQRSANRRTPRTTTDDRARPVVRTNPGA